MLPSGNFPSPKARHFEKRKMPELTLVGIFLIVFLHFVILKWIWWIHFNVTPITRTISVIYHHLRTKFLSLHF
jgi:hypothetical protein